MIEIENKTTGGLKKCVAGAEMLQVLQEAGGGSFR